MSVRTLRKLAVLVAFSSCAAHASVASAATVVIDFDTAALVTLSTADYVEDGFLMQSVSGHYDILTPGLVPAATSPYLSLDIRPLVGETVSAVRFTGGVFDLLSLDVFYSTTPGFGTQEITSSAGGQRFLEFAGTEVFSGPGWSNLTWIELMGTVEILGPGFDNISLRVVPVPPTLLLFATGLAGLAGAAGLKRRHFRRVHEAA